MNCPSCDRTIPDDAAFCIYCAAPAPQAPPVVTQQPATGATIRLDPGQAPMVAQAAPTTPRHHRKQYGRHGKHRQGKCSSSALGALIPIGIVLMFVTGSWSLWPGIFVLIGLSNYAQKNARGHSNAALREVVFWGGLALLFWTGTFWPGIVVLLIASSLIQNRGWGWRP